MGFGDSFKKIVGDKMGALLNPTALLGTAASVGGDYLAMQAAEKQAGKNRTHQDEVNAANYAMQKEFAQQGIRWKVEDAKAAGLHPLAAIGASGASASPSFQVPGNEGAPRSEFYSRMGQNVSRAISATSTLEEKLFKQLQIKSMDLDNKLKEKELANVGPNFPRAGGDEYLLGQGDVSRGLGLDDGRVIDTPFRRVVSDRFAPHKEAGAIQDSQIVRTRGGYAVVPSRDVKERIEDSPMEWQWLMRNFLRTYRTPDGTLGFMNPFTGELKRIPFTKKKIKGKVMW